MTLIELGEVSAGSAEPPPARPIRAIDLRRPGLVAVLVLCLLGVTGSAVPAEPQGLRTLWSKPIVAQPFILVGDTLYLSRADLNPPALEAWEAASGRLRWSRPLAQAPDWVYTTVPGMALLPMLVDLPDGSGRVGSVLALDERTGATLWEQDGEPSFADERGVLFVDWDTAADTLGSLRRVRPADGTELWSYKPAEPIASWATADTGSTWFATVTSAGHVEVRSMADGSVRRTGTVPWLPGDSEDGEGDYSYLFGVGEVLMVVRQQGGEQFMSAYDAGTMKPLWTWQGQGRGGTFTCGELICAGDRPGVRALDPATGRPVWQGPGWDYARPLDDRRMLYESHRDTNQGVFDTETGQILSVFPNGMVVADPENADVVVLAFTNQAPPELVVQRLRHDRLEIRGALGGSTDQGCQLSAGRLACLIGSGNKGYDLVVKSVA